MVTICLVAHVARGSAQPRHIRNKDWPHGGEWVRLQDLRKYKHHGVAPLHSLFGTLFAGCLLLTSAIASPTDSPVKRSGSGICHDQASPSYELTKRFKRYETLEKCLKDGGRLPKNLPLAQAQRSADSQAGTSGQVAANPKLVVLGTAVAAIVFGAGLWFWCRRSPRVDPEEALARRKWEGHRLESEGDEIFKRRPHRWDPWLKRIGYFDKDKNRYK